MNRKMIVIEGLDGSGKSTQVELLKQKLIDNNIKLRQIKLPDYENPSSTLVKMYLGGELGDKPSDVNAYAASTFYAVDRYASFKKFWQAEYPFPKDLPKIYQKKTQETFFVLIKTDLFA